MTFLRTVKKYEPSQMVASKVVFLAKLVTLAFFWHFLPYGYGPNLLETPELYIFLEKCL